LIDPLRRTVSAIQTETTRPPAAPALATNPAATPHAKDSLESQRSGTRPVNLDGASTEAPGVFKGILGLGLWGQGSGERNGPRLLHLEAGWTPQGQGYDAQRGEVLTTYYDESGVLLSLQDKGTGQETHQVRLGGLNPGDPAPSHGGGVSTDGEFVYVADTREIYIYRRADLEKAQSTGTPVNAFQVTQVPNLDGLKDPVTGIGLTSAASYMTVKDGFAYVGAYSKNGDGKVGAVWRYPIDEATGALNEAGRQGPIRAPDRAQGIAVVNGAVLFTTGDRKLIYQPIDGSTDAFKADIEDRTDISNGRIDPYAQGLNIIDGELWVTYESGSEKYRDKLGPWFEPREYIQRIPLDRLDLKAAGLEPGDLQG